MRYRKRIPSALKNFVEKNEIKKVLKSELEALEIDLKISNSVKIANSDFDDKTKYALIEKELDGLLEVANKEEACRYFDAVKLYLDQSDVTEREWKSRVYFFNELLPALLKYVYMENPVISEITPKHLNKIADIIKRLPSRNHDDLKRKTSYDLVKNTVQGKYTDRKILHVETVNKMIKRIRSLSSYGYKTGLFSMTAAIPTFKNHSLVREQRMALTEDEISFIVGASKNQEVKDFIVLLYYTGMRLGELYKYKLSIIDGVECFDLRDAKSLKTKTSFRIIPRHPKIKVTKFTYSYEHLSRKVKALINSELEDTERKTTYSLRHSFATNLIQKGADPTIVSELMGHSHTTMTLSRYSTGFSVRQLREVVELL